LRGHKKHTFYPVGIEPGLEFTEHIIPKEEVREIIPTTTTTANVPKPIQIHIKENPFLVEH